MTNAFFNTTVTYRTDSTVFMPFDSLVRITAGTPIEWFIIYTWDVTYRKDSTVFMPYDTLVRITANTPSEDSCFELR
ncbi:hypothetical protein GPALN_011625 [Globodera pallida]|nr:hypothetical protein GPALN_011625 [Globodera pallida]